MKQALQGWMDRVMFVRDPTFNQAFRQLSDVVLRAAPTPEVATEGQSVDGIAITGIGTSDGKPLAPGGKADIHVYFRVDQPTTAAYRFALAAWPVDRGAPPGPPSPGAIYRTPSRTTAAGAFATDRWKAGDFVRERFTVTLPMDWRGDGVVVGLVAEPASGPPHKPTGPSLAIDPGVAVLGTLPMRAPGSSSTPNP
jgi:hypothetical protein